MITANPVVLARRMAMARDIRAETDSPLSILFHRNAFARLDDKDEIVDDGRDLFDAGSDFAALYWRLHGKPFARGADLNAVHGSDAIDPVRALRDERAYQEAIRALDALGRNTRTIVIACCAHFVFNGTDRHLQRLKSGLGKLASLGRPRLTDAERDQARAEMAA